MSYQLYATGSAYPVENANITFLVTAPEIAVNWFLQGLFVGMGIVFTFIFIWLLFNRWVRGVDVLLQKRATSYQEFDKKVSRFEKYLQGKKN